MSQFIQVLAAVILSLNSVESNESKSQQPEAYSALIRIYDNQTENSPQFTPPLRSDDQTARLVLEEIEDSVAILETSQGRIYIPKDLLPPGTHEGNVLKLSILQEETDLRLAEAQSRIERMKRLSR